MNKAVLTKFNILFLSILLAGMRIYAQSSSTILELKIRSEEEKESLYVEESKVEIGRGTSTTNLFFRIYKKRVSSQDKGVCHFSPSCSEYGLIATQKQGMLIGIINTIDRLSRCNGNNEQFYQASDKKGLLIDDVRNHKYEKL